MTEQAAETAESTDSQATADTGQSTAESTPAQKSALDIATEKVAAAYAKKDDAGEQAEEPEQTETATKKGPVKQSVQDRISSYADRAKTAEAERDAAVSKLSELQGRLAEIESRRESGEISGKAASDATDEAREELTDLLASLDLPEELEPYAEKLLQVGTIAADKRFAELIKPYEEERKQREETKIWEDTRKVYETGYDSHPALFEEANDEGIRPLKEVHRESFNRLVQLIDIRSPEGWGIMLDALAGGTEGLAEENARLKAELAAAKTTKAKRGMIESPHGAPSGGSVADRPMTALDFANKRVQEAYGRK